MSYASALTAAIEAAREAGALLREERYRPGGPRGHGAHADADDEAEAIIRARLLDATDWSYLGEETGRVTGADARHRWLVDPNDGTVEFLRGARGSAVSIAALRDGVPVLGVVYAFAWPDDDGDLLTWVEGGALERNGAAIGPDLSRELDGEAIVALSAAADGKAAANARCVAPGRFFTVPSLAYRLALAATGDVQAGASLHGAGAWDYGGAHALILGAGGAFLDGEGAPVDYDAEGQSRRARSIGGAPRVVRALLGRPWQEVLRGQPDPPRSRSPLVRLEPGRSVRDTARLRRAQGCLLGQLAGDALGAQVEFQTRAAIAAAHPGGLRTLRDGGTWNTLAGQPTDDSELALALARSLVRERRWDEAAVMAAYRGWMASDPFDVGNATRAALGLGRPDGQTKANGSLMRASPLGVFRAGRPAEAAQLARADSALTHPNPTCVESCAAFVAAIAAGIAGASAREMHAAALREAREPSVRAALEEAATRPPADFETHAGYVLTALQNAFYRLLHAPTFEEAVVDTVMQGGDTDTNAAICGALAGALHGRDAVPAAWRMKILTCRPLAAAGARRVRPMAYWPVDALVLAERLLLESP